MLKYLICFLLISQPAIPQTKGIVTSCMVGALDGLINGFQENLPDDVNLSKKQIINILTNIKKGVEKR